MLSEFSSHRNFSKFLCLYCCTLLEWCVRRSGDVGTFVQYVGLVFAL
jgi:hypothetical protein